MSGGDTLLIQAGTYTECIAWNEGFPWRNGSSPSNQTRYARYQNDTVIIRPGGGGFQVLGTFQHQYIDIDGLSIDATGRTHGIAVKFEDSIGMRLANCDLNGGANSNSSFQNGQDTFASIVGGSNHTIMNNTFHHGFYYGMYFNPRDSLVEGNIFRDNGGYGLHHDLESASTVNNNIIRNNIFTNNGFRTQIPDLPFIQQAAVTIARGDNAQFYNNVIYSNWGGIQVDYAVNNTQFYHNTIYNNQSYPCMNIGSGGFTVPANTIIRNNICYQNGSDIVNEGAGTVQSNNLLTDPLLVNAGSGDFHLLPNSPAINAGVSLFQVPTDFEGTPRPQGGAYDIGADEYGAGVGSSPTPTPLPSGASCSRYAYGSFIPPGFAVPWDVTSPSTILVSAECAPPTILLKVGNRATTKTLYVYKTAYTAPSGASSWTPVDLIGGPLIILPENQTSG
jgi:hypothetical protein